MYLHVNFGRRRLLDVQLGHGQLDVGLEGQAVSLRILVHQLDKEIKILKKTALKYREAI